MKKFIVYTIYYIGDFVWISGYVNLEVGYNLYNFLMLGSYNLQNKYNLDEPWKEPSEEQKLEI